MLISVHISENVPEKLKCKSKHLLFTALYRGSFLSDSNVSDNTWGYEMYMILTELYFQRQRSKVHIREMASF